MGASGRLWPPEGQCGEQHLKLMVVEDARLNGPHIELLKALDMRFVLGAKPRPRAPVPVGGGDAADTHASSVMLCAVNDAKFELEVELPGAWERCPNGRYLNVSSLDPAIANPTSWLDAAPGARWRIENQTFNTLKNQGYGFEHNFVTAKSIWRRCSRPRK